MNLLLIAVALTGLIWLGLFVLRVPLTTACIVFVVCAACLGPEEASYSLAGKTVSLDRLFFPLLLGTYFVQRRLGLADPKPLGRLEWLLVAFALLLTISTFTHDYHAHLKSETSAVYRLLVGYLMPISLYWIARQAPIAPRRGDTVLALLVVLGVYLGVTGILEVHEQWWAVFPRAIADPKLGLHFGRARGPMLTSVSYGLFVATGLIASLLWRPKWGQAALLVPMVCVPLTLAGVYYSYTRSVWMGAATGLMIVLWFKLRGIWRPLIVGGAVACGALVLVTQWDRFMGFEREYSASDTRESANMRTMFVYVSWEMFKDKPLLGFGFGQFPREKLPYLDDRSVDLPLQAIRELVHHNTLLCILTETGLVGLLLYVSILWCCVRDAWRMLHHPRAPDWMREHALFTLSVFGIYIWQLGFHELSYAPQDNALLFLVVGIMQNMRVTLERQEGADSAEAENEPAEQREVGLQPV